MTDESKGVGDVQTPLEFFCECGDPTCRRTIVLTLDEYNELRPDPILHADHETPSSSRASSPSSRSR